MFRPIFVIGAGRSGSTEFHGILSRHPNLAWLSGAASKHPDRPERNRQVMRAIDYPVVGPWIDRRLFRGEFYRFWDHWVRGFSAPFRDLVAGDVTEKVRSTLPSIFERMLTNQRDRILIKITGWPRIGFLQAIFPDARFIHVLRDGRAVANSALAVDFWRGFSGPENWGWGQLSAEHAAEWNRHNRSFVALAAIQWKMLMDSTRLAIQQAAPGSVLEIKYERMCAEPLAVFEQVSGFCGLEWAAQFRDFVRQRPLVNANSKWRQELTAEQQAILEDVLRERLEDFGYRDAPAPVVRPGRLAQSSHQRPS